MDHLDNALHDRAAGAVAGELGGDSLEKNASKAPVKVFWAAGP
jgi:hypothetical protein